MKIFKILSIALLTFSFSLVAAQIYLPRTISASGQFEKSLPIDTFSINFEIYKESRNSSKTLNVDKTLAAFINYAKSKKIPDQKLVYDKSPSKELCDLSYLAIKGVNLNKEEKTDIKNFVDKNSFCGYFSVIEEKVAKDVLKNYNLEALQESIKNARSKSDNIVKITQDKITRLHSITIDRIFNDEIMLRNNAYLDYSDATPEIEGNIIASFNANYSFELDFEDPNKYARLPRVITFSVSDDFAEPISEYLFTFEFSPVEMESESSKEEFEKIRSKFEQKLLSLGIDKSSIVSSKTAFSTNSIVPNSYISYDNAGEAPLMLYYKVTARKSAIPKVYRYLKSEKNISSLDDEAKIEEINSVRKDQIDEILTMRILERSKSLMKIFSTAYNFKSTKLFDISFSDVGFSEYSYNLEIDDIKDAIKYSKEVRFVYEFE
ncbi:MAG: hypothetical protein MUE53_08160 [Chitinophagales bacterium]|jgi:uncharacterized protein YggE|nr:hypothetical protein [Chitinophagales bacterium]